MINYSSETRKSRKSKKRPQRIEIIKQQLRYEEEQVESLEIISKGKYTGNFNAVERKTKKIEELKNKLKHLISKTPPPPGDGR